MMQPLAPLHEIFAPAKRSNREGRSRFSVALHGTAGILPALRSVVAIGTVPSWRSKRPLFAFRFSNFDFRLLVVWWRQLPSRRP